MSLTCRQTQVLTLIAHGLSNQDIARHLCRSYWTIGGHIKSIYRRLDIHTRAEATLHAQRMGLI